MAVRKDTIFERFLAPIFQNFLIDQAAMEQFYRSIDWEETCDRLKNPNLIYPEYYQSQNFHGIEGGYLTIGAAVSYDPVTQYVLPPNETWVRQGIINAIGTQPRRILDLGCGTGSTTLLLKQAFPAAEVVGLDLSPYMLAATEAKAKTTGLDLRLVHGNAEYTGFEDDCFDLVTASLLFHETPPAVTQSILRESFRLLQTGGQMIILDGNQKTLRQVEWLTQIFEEPYIQAYAAESLDAMLGAAGFAAVRTDDWWGIHQISCGVKPLQNHTVSVPSDTPQAATFSGSPQWA
jgi:ubiquinone/menaquinone biosynthesis C-methylase UbiE